MSKETENRAAYLAALFARMNGHPAPHEIAKDVATLRSLSRSLERLAVKACNMPTTSADELRAEKLQARLLGLAGKYRMDMTTSGDPRGHVVKLWKRGEVDQPRAAGDAFGGGWGVY
jgi:hypothetical protein